MANESRTQKSIMNASFSLLFYFLNVVVGFLIRRYTLHALGAEITGMKSTIGNFLGMLSLAELGIGVAIASVLYKPLYAKDEVSINEIVSVQGWFYRRVALAVTLGAIGVMCFFPQIFEKAEIPMWTAYATFALFLFNALVGYVVNYRSSVLLADQKGYKLTIYTQSFYIVKNLLQIVVLLFVKDIELAYALCLLLDFSLSVFGVYMLEVVLRREYPWLKPEPKRGKILLEKYRIIITKTKQVFVHQLAGVVLNSSGSLIIYGFTSLTLVAKYENYMMIVLSLNNLANQMFNSIGAGIGHLVAEGNKEKILRFFWEMIALKHYIATVLCFGALMFSHAFITLWVGEEFRLDNQILILIVLFIFISLTRSCELFTIAYGLFDDVWAPVTECLLNMSLSVALGYYWGLPGIIMGIIISLVSIILIWKPYYLFCKGFQTPVWEYWKNYLKYPIVSWLMLGGSILFVLPSIGNINNFMSLLRTAIIYTSLFALLTFVLYYAISSSFRFVSYRFYEMARNKISKKRKRL